MDAILTAEMIKALTEGNLGKFLGYVVIFSFLWIEVRGLKKEVIKLTETIGESFQKGEARFTRIEGRIEMLEHKTIRGS